MLKRNEARAAKKFRRNFHSDAFVGFTHSRPCFGCNARTGIQCSHMLKARGMGGAGGDWREILPLCSACHDEWGASKVEFLGRRGFTEDDVRHAQRYHREAFRRYMDRLKERKAAA